MDSRGVYSSFGAFSAMVLRSWDIEPVGVRRVVRANVEGSTKLLDKMAIACEAPVVLRFPSI